MITKHGTSLLLCGCQLHVSCGYLVNLVNTFQSYKSYGEMMVEQGHGKFNTPSWPYDRLLRTAVLFYIWEASL